MSREAVLGWDTGFTVTMAQQLYCPCYMETPPGLLSQGKGCQDEECTTLLWETIL